jgi:hypothetical protein
MQGKMIYPRLLFRMMKTESVEGNPVVRQRPHLGGWASTSEGASCKALLHHEVSSPIPVFAFLAYDESGF